MQYNLSAGESQKLQSLKAKYSQTPRERCDQAVCRQTEECLLLTIALFNLDETTVSANKIKQALDRDKQYLLDEQKAHTQSYSWIWGSNDQTTHKYRVAENLIEKHGETSYFFATHQKYLQGRSIVNLYKDMPLYHASISYWIKNNKNAQERFPLQAYKNQAAQDLHALRDMSQADLIRYPKLARELEKAKESIQTSLYVIESDYKKECVEIEESKIRTLQAERIAEEISRIKLNAKALMESMQIAKNANVLASEKNELLVRQNERLFQLNSYLYGANLRNLKSESDIYLDQLQESLRKVKNTVNSSTHDNKILMQGINDLISLIQQEIQNKATLGDTEQLRTIAAQTQLETKDLKAIKASLQKLQREIANRPSQISVAHAEYASIPVATPIDESGRREPSAPPAPKNW